MAYLAEIPYGAYWSTPFAKWQGSFANLHSVEFAAHVAKAELAKRRIAPDAFDYRRARHDGAAEGVVLRPAVVHGADRRPQGRRADHRPGLRHQRALPARRRPGNRGGARVDRTDRDLRSHLQRPAHCLSQSVGAGRHRRARELGARQFLATIRSAATPWCRPPRTSRANIKSPPPRSTRWCCAAASNTRRRWPTTTPFRNAT